MILLLEHLLEQKTLSHRTLQSLEKTYRLSQQDAEVQGSWLLVGDSSHIQAKLGLWGTQNSEMLRLFLLSPIVLLSLLEEIGD